MSFVEHDKISAGHAKILVGLSNAEFIAKKIIEKKLSVRQSENLVRILRNKKNIKTAFSKDVNISNLEKSLEEKTGLNIQIKNKKNNQGKITFEYRNLEQLDRLIGAIKNNY